MTKLTLTTVGSTLTNTAAAQINANNAATVAAVENTLSRDGSTPNNMQADIDMDGNDLLNVKRIDVESLFIDGEGVQSVNLATALKITNNLSDVANVATARTNLGLTDTATSPSSAFGKSLIDDVTASDARSTLGLTIGTDIQAWDAGLQSISSLTISADQLLYTTALDTYATTSLTAYGRSLIDDVDATAARSTLGLGTIATQSSSNVSITGGSISGVSAVRINNTAGNNRDLEFDTSGVSRWMVRASNDAEGGGNAGSNFQIVRRDDAGAFLDFSLSIARSTGAVTIPGSVSTGALAPSSFTIPATVSGTLPIANGGTNAATAAAARTNLGLVIGTDVQAFRLVGSATYDPPSLADGAGTSTTVTVTGAALGDFAIPSFSLDLQGITVTAYVSSANTCTVRFQNETGGVLDLASGTLRVAVFK